jgi:hypothetical protein
MGMRGARATGGREKVLHPKYIIIYNTCMIRAYARGPRGLGVRACVRDCVRVRVRALQDGGGAPPWPRSAGSSPAGPPHARHPPISPTTRGNHYRRPRPSLPKTHAFARSAQMRACPSPLLGVSSPRFRLPVSSPRCLRSSVSPARLLSSVSPLRTAPHAPGSVAVRAWVRWRKGGVGGFRRNRPISSLGGIAR